ncbi:MAG: hypothetical protein ABI629_20355 [bacterium]
MASLGIASPRFTTDGSASAMQSAGLPARQPGAAEPVSLCGTYVIIPGDDSAVAYPRAARLQWLASGAIVVMSIGLAGLGENIIPQAFPGLEPVLALQRQLDGDARFFTVGVSSQTVTVGGGGTTRTLVVDGWYRGMPSPAERARIVDGFAAAALARFPDIDEYDFILVQVTSAYDLGIARGHISYRDNETIPTWRARTVPAPVT